jgi:hypothetical protein
VVQLATPQEVSEGTSDTKAITPASLSTALATDADLQTEANTRLSADNALQAQITPHTTALNAATDAATADTLVKRDGAGRFKAVNGLAASDVATKGQMDTADSALQSQITPHTTALNAATDAATANTLCKRDVDGRVQVADANTATQAVSKGQLDAVNTVVSGHTSTLNAATHEATASAIVKRDANGRAQVADGSAAADIATKGQLNKVVGGYSVEALTLTNSVDGAATPSKAHVSLDTYGAAASQNCTNLLTTNDIQLLVVRLANASHVVVLKHGQAGDGGLLNADGLDISLTTLDQTVLYYKSGSNYKELGKFGFGVAGAHNRSVKSTNFNIAAGDNTYICTASLTATLPSIGSAANTRALLVLPGRVQVTVSRNGANIEGVADNLLVKGPCSMQLTEDGSSWWIVR